MRKNLMIALVAGTLCPVALAQVNDLNIPAVHEWGHDKVVRALNGNPGGYSDRANVLVYSTGLAAETGGGFAGPGADAVGVLRVQYDDILWDACAAPTGGITINGISFGGWVAGDAPLDTVDWLFTFYPNHDANASPPYSGTPVGDIAVRVGGNLAARGQGYFFNAPIAITGGPTMPVSSGVSVFSDVYDNVELPTPTQLAGYNTISRANHFWNAGNSDGYRWFSPNGSNVITSADRTPTTPPSTPANNRSIYLRLQADVVVSAPAADHAMGCVNDGVTTHSFTLADNDIYWVEVCLNQDAVDDTLKFIDFDTEGSTAPVSMAIYNSAGVVVGLDTAGSGSGGNAQQSYGIGRRSEIGDGVQYDGRSSRESAIRGLAAGTYLVAIGPVGSTFAPGWCATANGTGGSVSVNVTTNLNNGSLAPSVPPLVLADLGNLLSPGGQIPASAMNAYEVKWFSFSTCTATNDTNLLEINLNGTATTSSSGVHLFDGQGNRVAFAEFGTGGVAGPLQFSNSPSLPAGQYYVALAYQGHHSAPDPITNGRWHLRSTNGSGGFNFQGEVLVSWDESACTGAPCEPDFNQDGNVDQDDIACLAQVVAGDPSCSGLDPDFNGDGNVDQDDIDALAQVVAGQPCP